MKINECTTKYQSLSKKAMASNTMYIVQGLHTFP